MSDTAVSAVVQGTTGCRESVANSGHLYDITHMVFANGEHEKFYFEMKQYQSPS